MDEITGLKGVFAMVFTALTAWLGILSVPIYILVILCMVDYFTGMFAAPARGERINSNKGFTGIAKKVCVLLLVGLGAAIDWLVIHTVTHYGLEWHIDFLVATFVAVWLISNELISILENMVDMGVKIPPFLMPLVAKIKGTVENQANNMGGDK